MELMPCCPMAGLFGYDRKDVYNSQTDDQDNVPLALMMNKRIRQLLFIAVAMAPLYAYTQVDVNKPPRQKKQAPAHKAAEQAEKDKEKRKEQQHKMEEKLKKKHMKLQQKEVRKRMRKNKRKAKRVNDNKREFFIIRWFRKKARK